VRRLHAQGKPSSAILSNEAWRTKNPHTLEIPVIEGFDPTPALENLLAADAHLKATCVNAVTLAKALEVTVLTHFAEVPVALSEDASISDLLTDHLVRRLFEADYSRRVYFRLYNLLTDQAPLAVEPIGASLQLVERWRIPLITGETTPTSTLHADHTGDTFLVFEDKGYDNDIDWWQARWRDAYTLLTILKYLKYGIVDVDYSVIHFEPDWLNEVRRYGITIWGRPRPDVQKDPYILARHEDEKLQRYMVAALKYRDRFEDLRPTLRWATFIAGTYYEQHHTRTAREDQLIDLSIALEALFSPDDRTELTFRITQTAALLLGSSPTERKEIARFLRKAYQARSSLVHGGKSPFGQGTLSVDDIPRLGDLIRRAILRMAILFVRGQQSRENVLADIEACSFDTGALAELRKRSDVEDFLNEIERTT
jgi:hypothetical protein